MHKTNTTEYFTLETTHPLAGRGETLTMKEWKRVYGYPDNLLGRGKLIPAPQPPKPIALNAPAPAGCPKPPKQLAAQHTPGPWKQCPGPEYETEAKKRGNQLFVQTATGSVICECRRMATFGPVQDGDLANSKVIAAAPELLEACKLAASAMADGKIRAQLVAAIKKATL